MQSILFLLLTHNKQLWNYLRYGLWPPFYRQRNKVHSQVWRSHQREQRLFLINLIQTLFISESSGTKQKWAWFYQVTLWITQEKNSGTYWFIHRPNIFQYYRVKLKLTHQEVSFNPQHTTHRWPKLALRGVVPWAAVNGFGPRECRKKRKNEVVNNSLYILICCSYFKSHCSNWLSVPLSLSSLSQHPFYSRSFQLAWKTKGHSAWVWQKSFFTEITLICASISFYKNCSIQMWISSRTPYSEGLIQDSIQNALSRSIISMLLLSFRSTFLEVTRQINCALF